MDAGMTQLSKHFALQEFTASQTAERMGREIIAPPEVVANLRRLCNEVLEPARSLLGIPFFVSSGYRPAWLNAAIGGSKTSAHMDGRAADIKVAGMSSPAFARWLHARGLPTDQVIEEGTWVHIGIAADGKAPRRELLTATFKDGKATYTRVA
jgi:zinc D-Ala-D-Ala carboxypeptidase